MTDKAVSTEDLMVEIPLRNPSLDAARLEAVIKALVENKVEALKNEKRKSSSITSSPKSLINRLRITSLSSVSSVKDKDDLSMNSHNSRKCKRMKLRQKNDSKPGASARKSYPHYSPKQRQLQHKKNHSCDQTLHYHENSLNDYSFLPRTDTIIDCPDSCCCQPDNTTEFRMHFDDDYISLKIDDSDVDLAETHRRALRKAAQRRRRRRRHRKHRYKTNKLRLDQFQTTTTTSSTVDVNAFKEIDPDELSKRARLAIAITAFMLLFMCLLLVGITLRMAPIIDDMVSRDNEELMNSLSGEFLNHQLHSSLDNNSTTSVPSSSK